MLASDPQKDFRSKNIFDSQLIWCHRLRFFFLFSETNSIVKITGKKKRLLLTIWCLERHMVSTNRSPSPFLLYFVLAVSRHRTILAAGINVLINNLLFVFLFHIHGLDTIIKGIRNIAGSSHRRRTLILTVLASGITVLILINDILSAFLCHIHEYLL